MKKIVLKHVNAFTTTPFRGNPAGVIPDARGLSDETMQSIARELGMPETAFVLPPTLKAADLQIRWFTPAVEVPLCGHATIGAFHALAEDGMHGMRNNGSHSFVVQTKSGLLQVKVEKSAAGIVVEFQLPVPKFSVVKTLPPSLGQPLGVTRNDLDPALPLARSNYLYIPIKKRSRLWELKPDMNALAEGCRRFGFIGVSLVTLQTIEVSSAFHSRFFAPAAGINEDPVTGSANGPLGVYSFMYGVRKGIVLPSYWLPDDRLEFIGEQGDIMGRKGRVRVRLKVKKGGVGDVRIAGEAITLFKSALTL
ncbi:MAG: PhzF family phenazine biosynthesis protein [Bacteroidota bacterium]